MKRLIKQLTLVIALVFNLATVQSQNNQTCTDGSGNNYPVVQIGDQVWMAENLKTTKYNDGTSIPLVTSDSNWAGRTTPAYCWYGNDKTTAVANGHAALYNWYTVDTDKLCPTGWHVPTDDEWGDLEDYITSKGHDGTVGTVLKSTTGWGSYGNGTDDYGFSALPGGYRNHKNGMFNDGGEYGLFWSSTENGSDAYGRSLGYVFAEVQRDDIDKSYGLYVRCLRD